MNSRRSVVATLCSLTLSAVVGCGGSPTRSERLIPPIYPLAACLTSEAAWSATDPVQVWRPYDLGADAAGVPEHVGVPEESFAIRGDRVRIRMFPPTRPRHPTGCGNFREARVVELNVIDTGEGNGLAGGCAMGPGQFVRSAEGWTLGRELAALRLEDGSPAWRRVTAGELDTSELALLAPCELGTFHGVPPWWPDAASAWLRTQGIDADWSAQTDRERAHLSCLVLSGVSGCLDEARGRSVDTLVACLDRGGLAETVQDCERRMVEYDVLDGPP